MNKTKVIATIGPSTCTKESLREIMIAGIDCARINFSHATHDFATETIENVRQLNKEINKNVSILIDLAGPDIRIGALKKSEIEFITGAKTVISKSSVIGDTSCFSTNYPDLLYDLEITNKILLNDGNIELVVENKDQDNIYCSVLRGGKTSARRGVNIPGVNLNIPFLSSKDKADINFAVNMQVDYIALSFARTEADVLDVYDMLISLNDNHIQLITKIENEEAVHNIDQIIKISDGIMIARGDLGVEIDLESIPGIQKKIIKTASQCNKFTIVATEMLASMQTQSAPTRAEVSDIANAVLDGVDAVMLSAETAIGDYPTLSVLTMKKIIEPAEKSIDYNAVLKDYIRLEEEDITSCIAYSVVDCANRLNAKAIVISTISGYTAKQVSHFRAACPVIVTSPDEKTVLSLSLNWGITPVLVPFFISTDEVIDNAIEITKNQIDLNDNDNIIITGGLPLSSAKNTNFMKVETIRK